MSTGDIGLGAARQLPVEGQRTAKPNWLIKFEQVVGKDKKQVYFITLDRPDLLGGMVQTKGIFSSLTEEKILKTFSEILTKSSHEDYCEVLIPYHTISIMRSLVFKQKPAK